MLKPEVLSPVYQTLSSPGIHYSSNHGCIQISVKFHIKSLLLCPNSLK